MVRIGLRDGRSGRSRPRPTAAEPPGSPGGAAAVRVRAAAAPLHPPPADRLDPAERERRSHIRRWAAFMIVHLERSEHDHARHYAYDEALEKLQELIARELHAVRAENHEPATREE